MSDRQSVYGDDSRLAVRRSSSAARDLELPPSWLHWAARLGYAACGLVYLAVGAVAAAVAAGFADRPGDTQRVMMLVERLPMGKLILIALGVGLLGYAALNLVGAVRDPEQRGRGPVGVAMRLADVVTGALYAAFAVAAVRIAAAPGQEGGRILERTAAVALQLPGGAFAVASIGIGFIGAGAFLLYRARVEPFEDMFDRRAVPTRARRLLALSARFGTLARGVVMGVCGLLAVEAAMTRDPDHVGDVGEALSAIETTPAGRIVLGLIALGFIAYGAYQLAKVRYRRVQIR